MLRNYISKCTVTGTFTFTLILLCVIEATVNIPEMPHSD